MRIGLLAVLVAIGCSKSAEQRPQGHAGPSTSDRGQVERTVLHEGGMYRQVGAAHVYWGDLQERGLMDLWRSRKDGSEPALLARGLRANVRSFVLDDEHIFGIRADGIIRVDKVSGELERFAPADGRWVQGIAVDDAFVYFSDATIPGLVRVDKRGGEPHVLVEEEWALAEKIVSDGTYLYWHYLGNRLRRGNQEQVRSMPRQGGEARVHCEGEGGEMWFVGAADGLGYCYSSGEIIAFSASGESPNRRVMDDKLLFHVTLAGEMWWYDSVRDPETREWRPTRESGFAILRASAASPDDPVVEVEGLPWRGPFVADDEFVFVQTPDALWRIPRLDR